MSEWTPGKAYYSVTPSLSDCKWKFFNKGEREDLANREHAIIKAFMDEAERRALIKEKQDSTPGFSIQLALTILELLATYEK